MRYIILLRGINVGGKNKIAMKELVTCLQEAGFTNISTYINSGNLLLSSENENSETIQRICELKIREYFNFDISVAVLSKELYEQAMQSAPLWWGKDHDAKHNAIFLIDPKQMEEIQNTIGELKPGEQIAYTSHVIFYSVSLPYFTKAKLPKIVNTTITKEITVRNYNTAQKLLVLIKE